MKCTFPYLDPGVPYTVTVSARTTDGKGEPVSIVVFSVEQGKIDHRQCAKNCDLQNLCVRNTELLKILYYVRTVLAYIWVIHTKLYTRGGSYVIIMYSTVGRSTLPYYTYCLTLTPVALLYVTLHP